MNQTNKDITVIQPENMSIYEALELKELFLVALENHEKIEINLSNVSEIDSAGLQLMIALKKEASTLSKSISFTRHSVEVIDFLDLFNMTNLFGDPVIMGKTDS